MSSALDLTGQRFGRLVAVASTDERRGSYVVWLCRCDCGQCTTVKTGDLRSGNTCSCGCLHSEKLRQWAKAHLSRSKGNRRHGRYGTPEYFVWRMMKNRCLNAKVRRYEHYGGRGIRVCERWSDFANFYADMGPRPEGISSGGRALYSLERIDNDGDYEPSNCRWATAQEQQANKRVRQ